MINKNCRISYDLFNQMHQSKLTASEIIMLLYLVQIQDQFGHCPGIYYSDLRNKYAKKGHHFAHRTFYDSLKSLSEKKIIVYKKTGKGDYDIDLIKNDFSIENIDDMKNSNDENGNTHDLRYFKVNVEFFGDEFLKLSPVEMILAMDIYRQCVAARSLGDDASGSITFKIENFYHIYSKKLKSYAKNEDEKIQYRTLQVALTKMKKLINVNRVNGLLKIQVKSSAFIKNRHDTLSGIAFAWAKVLIRRYKLSTTTICEMKKMIQNRTFDKSKNEKNRQKATRDLMNTISFLFKRLKKYSNVNAMKIEFEKNFFELIEEKITEYFAELNNSDNVRKWFDRDWNKHCRLITTKLYKEIGEEL